MPLIYKEMALDHGHKICIIEGPQLLLWAGSWFAGVKIAMSIIT